MRALEAGSDRRRIKTVVLPDGEQFKTLEQVDHTSLYCKTPEPGSLGTCSGLWAAFVLFVNEDTVMSLV